MAYKLVFYNTDEKFPTITSKKCYLKGGYHPDGLFSQQKFGPCRDWICSCGIKNEVGGTCQRCGVKYTTAENRRFQKGSIKLFKSFMNPLFAWMYNLSKSRSPGLKGNILKSVYHLIYYISYGVKLDTSEGLELLPLTPQNMHLSTFSKNRYVGASGAYKYLSEVVEAYPKIVESNSFLRFFKEHSKQFLIDEIIVLPPGLRPDMEVNKSKVISTFNQTYVHILNRLFEIKKTGMFLTRALINDLRGLQVDIISTYNNIAKRLGGKPGLIRKRMLGKRIDWSGRAVIAPDPTLDLDSVRIPYFALLELYKYQIASKASLRKSKKLLYHEIVDEINLNIRDNVIDQIYKNILEEIICDKRILLNRQPTLWKMGILAPKIKISPDKTIKMNTLIYLPFNADNDGDAMAFYLPVTNEAQVEAEEKIGVLKNLKSDADGSLNFLPSQDMIYGCYAASKYPKYHKYIPENIKKFFNGEVITSKKLIAMLNAKFREDENETVKLLQDIKNLGFKVATIANDPITLENLEECSLTREEINKKLFTSDNYLDNMKQEDKINEHVFSKFNQLDYITSGSRGSVDQLKPIISSRGYVSDCNGKIHEEPVKGNFVTGLTPKEFWISALGVRKGLVDIADSTAVSGALQRTLVYACINLYNNYNKVKDCGTDKYFSLNVKDERQAQSLIDRYILYRKKIIRVNKAVAKVITGHTILLRSPIGCKSEGFCRTCAPFKAPLHPLIGALILGNKLTQGVLRTFHFSGKASITDDSVADGQNLDIISDLRTMVNIFSKPKEYSFTNRRNVSDYFQKLFAVFCDKSIINPIFFEYLISQMIWTKDSSTLYRLSDYNCDSIIVSVNKIPSLVSWLTGLAHKDFKRKLLKSINTYSHETIFDMIILDLLKDLEGGL